MVGAAQDLKIEEPTRAALARLTGNEKECLRRRLRHQTAKEMALELGISPHAVEKRLKMARTKLGLSSSIEAARLLADFERYQQAGPQTPDLASESPQGQKWQNKPFVMGGIVMGLFAVALIALAAQAPSSAGITTAPTSDVPIVDERNPPSNLVTATPAEILVVIQSTFHTFDKNHSGYLEGEESPMVAPERGSPVFRRDENGKAVRTGEVVHYTIEQLRANFYSQADKDEDGKVSFAEFRDWDGPSLARQGIPADWKTDIDRPVPTTGPAYPADPG